MTDAPMRLQRYLSSNGIASRRQCAELIAQGRITVNGKMEKTPWASITHEDSVCFDGRLVRASSRKVYIALHKPPGVVVSEKDPQRRPVASSLFKGAISERLFHVGRLDLMSSGLIFYTNDGDFSEKVAHPSFRIEKEYEVKTRSAIPTHLLEQWLRGVRIDGELFSLKGYRLLGSRTVRLVLQEGKNREIRRVMIHYNIEPKRVHRLRIGPITLRGIPPGGFRRLNETDIQRILTPPGKRILPPGYRSLTSGKARKTVKEKAYDQRIVGKSSKRRR